MRFPKHKALIGLLFSMLPAVGTLAVLETPVISDLALRFALRIARFRTGLRIETQSWDVDAFSFSASLRDITVGIDDVRLRAPEVSVQISPLALLTGRLHLREVSLNSPVLEGEIPKRWLEGGGGESPLSSVKPDEIPKWIGARLAGAIDHLERRRLGFNRMILRDAQAATSDLMLARGNLEIENLDAGQIRAEWDLEGIELRGRLQPVERLTGAAALLREQRTNFYLTVRDFRLKLGADDALDLEFEGRWPGEFNAKVVSQLTPLSKWLRASPLVRNEVPAIALAGSLRAETRGQFRKGNLDSLRGSFIGKALQIDGYFPNDVAANFVKNGDVIEVRDALLTLPAGVDDTATTPPGILSVSDIRIEKGRIKGELKATNAGLCGILLAASVPDCYQSVRVNGVVPFDGTLSPLELKLSPRASAESVTVNSEPYTKRTVGKSLLHMKSGELRGSATVHEENISLEGLEIVWPDGSTVRVDGKVDYLPTLVDLAVVTDGAQLGSILSDFLNLSVQGKIKASSRIVYDETISRERGRTRIDADLIAEDFGIEGQNFGVVSGPIKYDRYELKIGTLKLTKGGGRAFIDGWLRSEKGATKLRIGGKAERLEVTATLPQSGEPFFHGYMSGTAEIDGHTDYEAHPDTFLNGPLRFDVDTLTLFGIPFPSGRVEAYYAKRILDVQNAKARKGDGTVTLAGKLYPESGTELRFSSDEITLKNLGWSTSLDGLQDGTIQVRDGFWAPAKGWGLTGALHGLKIAGRDLTEGELKISGDANRFRAGINLGADLGAAVEWDISGPERRWVSLKTDVKDHGLYALFAWLKRWDSENPITTTGGLHLDWKPDSGSLTLDNLEIRGPSGNDPVSRPLLKSPGRKTFAWQGSRIVRNEIDITGPAPFKIQGASGGEGASFEATWPAALVDLFIPSFRFRDGSFKVSGQLPLPPDLETMQASIQANDISLSIPGLGQPIVRGKGEFELASGRLNILDVGGALGAGEVSASGVYRIHLNKPGLSLDVSLNRAQVVIMDDVSMDVTGDMSLQGEQPPYLMSGKVLVTNGLWAKEFGAKPTSAVSVATEPTLRYNFDVELGANCRARNSVISTLATGKITLGGTDLQPEIQGSLDLLNGSVTAKSNEFRISQGRVAFLGGGTQIPNVNLLATTTMKQTSQDYRVQLHVRGPGDKLAVDLSSDPPLTQPEIVNLLAFGVIRPKNNESTDNAPYEALGAFLGSALSSSGLARSAGVQVRVETSQSIAQDRAIPKVTAVRRISDKVTATYGRSLELKPEQNIQVDYQLLKNVNLTGIWESRVSGGGGVGSEEEQSSSSAGVDLRFKFDLK